MEVSLESVIAEDRSTLKPVPLPTEWKEAFARVEAYLAAWRVGDGEWVRDCARKIVASARRRTVAEGREIEAAVEEADEFLKSWFEQSGAADVLIFGAPAKQGLDFGDRVQVAEILNEGALNLARAKVPARQPETRPMTMQTSLSRLPSIQLIGGWIILIAVLFLVFVVTHR